MITFSHRVRANANASIISLVQRFSDIAIIFLGLYTTCLFYNFNISYKANLISLTALVVFQMIGGITDFYRSWRGVKISAELIMIIKNWTLSIILTSGLISLFPDFDISVKVFLFWYFFVVLGFIVCRSFIRLGAGVLRKLGYNTRRVAVVGSSPAGISLLQSFLEEPWLGFVVKGIYDDNPQIEYGNVPYGGSLSTLIAQARAGEIDRIYIALSMKDEQIIKDLVSKLTDTTCSVLLIPDVFTFNILQSRTEEINGVPVVPLFDTPLSGINMLFKRLEDIVVSSIILVLISPVLIGIALAVKFSSPGPIIFRQIRYGMDGKPIKVWKFRSMTVMENDDKVIQATKNDVRVTKVGRFLRST
ncbi:sugar transferase, partial [Klebsiella pneumoniae]